MLVLGIGRAGGKNPTTHGHQSGDFFSLAFQKEKKLKIKAFAQQYRGKEAQPMNLMEDSKRRGLQGK